ncbi:MAG: Gfo/Idh/MocA family oxidoreductase [Bacillota bacterium]|nr:Gfo/Idh/MocA family oxidoreductase [Bacillota bacterium]MDW7678743.1 Gfo/Idh/MocA family oxidoreductase [Bacillota bacterium]
MKVAVIGLGSMGKRRIRLIQKLDDAIRIIGVDLSEERRMECENTYAIKTEERLEGLFKEEVDCVFVCTSPLSHSSIITQCLNRKMHVFTELNLVADDYDKNIALAKGHGRVLFLSSTFLYREEIMRIKSLLAEAGCQVNYIYHVGQYLPDWHPWENYKDFFVGDNRSNGCREIFAIEMPWLVHVFGDIEKVDAIKSRISGLEIGYNDNYITVLHHRSGHKGVLAVDVVSRKAVRNLEVYGEDVYLQWDGSSGGLRIYDFEMREEIVLRVYDEIDKLEHYSDSIIENAYMSEIVNFFNAIKGEEKPKYSFEEDQRILELIDRIES